MKHPRGLSLIEVATALAITAILLPVVGVVFYQVLFVPPEQSARITANNEVQRIATMLEQDAYMADNFSQGDGNPYYGNFSWTDYSTGDQFFVSYYHTGNNIARQMTVTPAAPTATPTPPTTMYTLTTSVVGSGTVTPNTSNPHANGSSVVVTANPATGWTFSSWFGDLSGFTNSTTITMDSNKAITAVFTQNTYTLTTSVVGSGSVTPASGSSYPSGSVVQVNASPASGWTFSSWSGDLSGSTSPAPITMNRNKSVTATFTQITYILTTAVVGSGTVTPASGSSYASGSAMGGSLSRA
jgi:Tfp pilus assembly protein PilV